jgi:hypothetical protein
MGEEATVRNVLLCFSKTNKFAVCGTQSVALRCGVNLRYFTLSLVVGFDCGWPKASLSLRFLLRNSLSLFHVCGWDRSQSYRWKRERSHRFAFFFPWGTH